MAKKKVQTIEPILTIELSYISDFFTGGGNSIDWNNKKQIELAKSAHVNDEAKKILHSTLRANFSATFKTKNLSIVEINSEIEKSKGNSDFKKVVVLSQKIQTYILDNTDSMFPELAGKDYPLTVDDNFQDKMKVEKNTLVYDTNLFNWIDSKKQDTNKFEKDLLDMLQEFVDAGLDKYVHVDCHYNCWNYYFKNKPFSYYNYTLQEIIDHRRSHLI